MASWYHAAEGYLKSDNLPVLVTKLLRATAEQVAPALGAPSAEDLLHVSLDLEVINRAMSWRSDITTDVPKFAYWQITPASDPPFDLGKASAEDSEWPQRKLYGERWGRFGAFASEDGRKWDWLWGRLDAAMTLSKQILCDANVPDSDVKQLQSALMQAILNEESQSDARVKTAAEKMLVLTGRDMWRSYASAASTPTRTSLRLLAAELTGTLVPDSWPKPIHALVDTSEQWRRHGPPTAVQRSRLVLYRLVGLTAQTIAAIKVAGLVKGKIANPPTGRRSPGQPDR